MAVLPRETHPVSGLSGTAFYEGNDAVLVRVEDNTQLVQDRLEALVGATNGSGVVYGFTAPLLAAGTGLQALVNPHSLMLGFVYVRAAQGSVALAPSATNHIYEFQDGTLVANTTGTDPATANNPTVKLGTAATNSSAVTSVTEVFRVWTPQVPHGTTANRPLRPVNGQTFLDDTLHKLVIYDGSNWRDTMGSVV